MKWSKHLWLAPFSASLFFASCSKNNSPAPDKNTATPLPDGLFVLNEGLNQHNNTTLTYYNFATQTATTDIYANVNDTTLGDTGNDIFIYGGKMYVVMNGSSYVAVIDKRKAQAIKRINAADGANWLPRHAVAYNGKILVSAWDGTVSVIDTVSLNITNTITVGANPEGLAVSGNMLYVANSGGLNYPNYDSTVSVVDLKTMKESKRIKVGINPQKLAADSKGNIYVFAWGNYNDVPAKVYKIDGSSQTLTDSSFAVDAYDKMIVYKDVLYFDGTSSQPVLTLNTSNIEGGFTIFTDNEKTFQTPYGIAIDDTNGDIYLTDAIDYQSPGKVYCLDNTGKIKFSFTAGINPDNVVFLR